MKVRKGENICNVGNSWEAESFGVGSYPEMIKKVTGVLFPTVIVRNDNDCCVDITGDIAVIYHPSIPEGEYRSYPLGEFLERHPGTIETTTEWCPSTGGFRAGDAPYEPGGTFRQAKPFEKGKVIVSQNELCVVF